MNILLKDTIISFGIFTQLVIEIRFLDTHLHMHIWRCIWYPCLCYGYYMLGAPQDHLRIQWFTRRTCRTQQRCSHGCSLSQQKDTQQAQLGKGTCVRAGSSRDPVWGFPRPLSAESCWQRLFLLAIMCSDMSHWLEYCQPGMLSWSFLFRSFIGGWSHRRGWLPMGLTSPSRSQSKNHVGCYKSHC